VVFFFEENAALEAVRAKVSNIDWQRQPIDIGLLSSESALWPVESRLDPDRLKRAFEHNWSELDQKLAAAMKLSDSEPPVPKRDTDSMIEETLDLVRELKRESTTTPSFPFYSLGTSEDGSLTGLGAAAIPQLWTNYVTSVSVPTGELVDVSCNLLERNIDDHSHFPAKIAPGHIGVTHILPERTKQN
jgi:hypothetical protein